MAAMRAYAVSLLELPAAGEVGVAGEAPRTARRAGEPPVYVQPLTSTMWAELSICTGLVSPGFRIGG